MVWWWDNTQGKTCLLQYRGEECCQPLFETEKEQEPLLRAELLKALAEESQEDWSGEKALKYFRSLPVTPSSHLLGDLVYMDGDS